MSSASTKWPRCPIEKFTVNQNKGPIDAVNKQSTSNGGRNGHRDNRLGQVNFDLYGNGKNDVDITIAFMPPARWRLRLNSVYSKCTSVVAHEGHLLSKVPLQFSKLDSKLD